MSFKWDEVTAAYAQARKTESEVWADWCARSVQFPFNTMLDEPPPCSPLELAQAYIRVEHSVNGVVEDGVTAEDIYDTLLSELGEDYIHKWSMATDAVYRQAFSNKGKSHA